MKKIKVKFTIDGLVHNLSHAEFPERLNEIQDSLRQYGHIVRADHESNPAEFIVEYEDDGWEARGWAEEMVTDLSSFGAVTMDRVVTESGHTMGEVNREREARGLPLL